MRVNMSAMGSCMLISLLLPARLDDAGHLALERQVAQLVAAEAELAVDPARTARQRAAVAQAHGRGITRQLLQLEPSFFLRLFGGTHVVDDFEQSRAAHLELRDALATFQVPQFDGQLGHGVSLQCLNGKRNAASSARASSSVLAVVLI